jgi:hypothetical protein
MISDLNYPSQSPTPAMTPRNGGKILHYNSNECIASHACDSVSVHLVRCISAMSLQVQLTIPRKQPRVHTSPRGITSHPTHAKPYTLPNLNHACATCTQPQQLHTSSTSRSDRLHRVSMRWCKTISQPFPRPWQGLRHTAHDQQAEHAAFTILSSEANLRLHSKAH